MVRVASLCFGLLFAGCLAEASATPVEAKAGLPEGCQSAASKACMWAGRVRNLRHGCLRSGRAAFRQRRLAWPFVAATMLSGCGFFGSNEPVELLFVGDSLVMGTAAQDAEHSSFVCFANAGLELDFPSMDFELAGPTETPKSSSCGSGPVAHAAYPGRGSGYIAEQVEGVLASPAEPGFGQSEPDILVLMVGANNAHPDAMATGALAQVGPDIFGIVAKARQVNPNVFVILLDLPPPADTHPYFEGVATLRPYLPQIASDLNVHPEQSPVRFVSLDGWDSGLAHDGLHPSPEGNATIAKAMRPTLREAMQHAQGR